MDFLEVMKSLPPEFSPAAFWFWYGELEPERLREQINMMMEQGVHNGFMHARAYLKTPYLGDEWWEAISACIDESNKNGFRPWLYDEYAWPSGTAGSTFDYGYQEPSRILAKGECNMAKSIVSRCYPNKETFVAECGQVPKNERLLRTFYKEGDVWKQVETDTKVEGEVLAFFLCVHKTLVDYMNKETIREFIDCTHEVYKARYGEQFGNRIPGIFFDEIYMVHILPWTERLPEEFKKRRGYDLLTKLPSLVIAGGEEERKVRKDYYQTVAELYEEAFFCQISEWCEENHLTLTGHTEEWLDKHPNKQGNYFDTIRHLDIPGADCHDYRYRFPRKITYREPKFAISVARAYGKERVMSEALGGAGWACPLQEFKRGVNTLGAMGINMITLHGFHSECETQGSQSDWPNSFFYQNPYWRYFKHFADYITRICYMNAQGSPVVEVGLYYPIEEMQMETLAESPTPEGVALDKGFNDTLNTMIEHQIDVDMIDGRSLLRAEVSEGRIRVGTQAFRVLLCPDMMRPSSELKDKLDRFEASGGIVLYYACGVECAVNAVQIEELPSIVASHFQPDVMVLRGERDNLYVNHRKIEEKDIYFISNSAPKKRNVTLLLRVKGNVQKLSPEDGALCRAVSKIVENGTEIVLSLAEDEACWLVVDSIQEDVAIKEMPISEIHLLEELAVPGEWEFLPLSEKPIDEKQLSAKSSEISIPLAMFASEIHPNGRQIRIQNIEDENGYCGRHLSLWKANWITHRPEGVDSSSCERLYFRRSVTLAEKPTKARICIAAINEWTLWVNGEEVAALVDGKNPSTVDITDYMTAGENVFAVEVKNKTPLRGPNLFSVEELPPEVMTSLLAQAEITVNGENITICTDKEWIANEQEIEGWQQPSYCPKVHFVQASAGHVWTNDIILGAWIHAWERGCPPLCPWGDLPLFDESISYPVRLCYSVVLPAGTQCISYPELTGTDVSITIDGAPAHWKADVCTLKPDGNTHQLQIALTVNGPTEGLHKSVKVEVVPFRTMLSDWRLHGLKWYSGFARYQNYLRLNKQPGRYLLDLGQVAFYTEVWINGKKAGERVWEPYRLDVTDLLQDGENEIVVIVANAAAVSRQFMLVDEGMALGWNRYWNEDNIHREGDKLVSGLLGPIQLLRYKEITEKEGGTYAK